MAKDKSKKSGKGFADDSFGKPSDAPAGDSWNLADDDNVGKLLLITPLRLQDVTTNSYGDKEVVVADVVVIDEKKPAKSEEHEEVFVFGGWLKGALKGYIGERRVVARLRQEKDKSAGRGYVWKFEDGSEKDIAKVREYLASLDPFKTKKGADDKGKGKKAKAEPEKPAKKKSKK